MHQMRKIIYTILLLAFGFCHEIVAQDDNIYEDLLMEEVEVENPVYMPELGIGPGVLSFYGELRNEINTPLYGENAMKVNVSAFIDKKHFVKANFYIFLFGQLSGSQYNFQAPENTLNFKSEISTFGINTQYSFEHLIPKEKFIHPFITLGVEMLSFNSKTDIMNADGERYIPGDDGVYRNEDGDLITRDYNYETPLREELDYGLGKYGQSALSIPVGIGVQLKATERAYIQLGASLHYILSDVVDHVSGKNTQGIIGDKANDMFTCTYVTLHYDLFSDPKSVTVRRLFADVDFDMTMYGDEDNDMVLDRVDECLDHPPGIEVDTMGCPYDDDNDGVADFKDDEPNTPPGAFVDDRGVQISEKELIAMLDLSNAVGRDEVDYVLKSNLGYSRYAGMAKLDIPKKFKSVDVNNDGYISYDELLKTLDDYFDFKVDFSINDINELKDFFFAQ